MDTIFMNSENSRTSEPHILKLKLTDKLDLRLDKKVIALSNVSMYYTWNNIKSSYNNNKFKILTPTWNEEFRLPDGSYYQHDSRVLYTFVPNKSFGSLLDISPSNHIFLKTFNSEYDEIAVWFTDQNSKPLEIEDRINLTMVIK